MYTNADDFAALLKHLNACEDAREWAKGKSASEAWADCERGDWMLWLAARVGVDRRIVVLAACACARLSLKRVAPGDDRPRIAIETAERWARGEATSDEVRTSAAAADAYASAAYATVASAAAASAAAYAASAAYASAAYAADAAADASAAAYAAYAAAAAAAYAADADYAAAYAAYAAYAADDARRATLKECADIVRKMVPL